MPAVRHPSAPRRVHEPLLLLLPALPAPATPRSVVTLSEHAPGPGAPDSNGRARVTVRAVTGSLSPYLWMTDTAWYDPARNSANFLILQQPSRPELTMLRGRFGSPARTYEVAGDTVLVWHANLLRTQGQGQTQRTTGRR